MGVLLALIPAIGYGVQPLIATKVGGSPSNQIFGTGFGAAIVGVIMWAIFGTASGSGFWWAFLAGALWSLAQAGQYVAFTQIGVTRTMPISTGLQVVGTSLIGILIFGEWNKSYSKWVGAIAILLVVIGVALTAITDKKEGNSASASIGRGLAVLVPTTIGYWAYSALPKALDSVSGTHLLFPEMLGIFVGAIIYNLVRTKGKSFAQKESWQNGIIGIVFGISSLAYIFAAKDAGVATSFVITQMNVVVSTLGGLFILHESKTPREMKFTLSGLALIVVGSVMTAFL
ncbi:GRP family sugar transporter [Companilactobacillus sp.]|uniref:GRP family sugar transporter n=1 Tax=Companilactobacillus sp. TaxID=2767905 RepID=UPI0025C036F4|nr:GRP family sugar transporter [Companilactobacillus sp.]MCH4009786.1 GRP family sugar transporter [Companilactobacillus sp.]MCH4052538.1 GRP family sugar transporter [Companilactobacillus sp.]MCH4077728.1 GRP family sugar transporter [Companilactobacillus sp.]MCH4126304.1 GRP family sugar transporter [Companilactobacillus sp.]MCI1312012.1 GRP family sugar transporter [Companilactobacillus sp.]